MLDGSWALAVAVCDGAGDDSDAADAAQISAQIAAAVTGSTNSGAQGLHAARSYLQQRNEDAPPGQEGITTAVVAAITPAGLDMAWVGDSPAWAVHLDGKVVPLTVPSCHPRWAPCNVEEKHEAAGTWPHRMLTNTDDYARIILASDGLTAHLPLAGRADQMNAMLDILATIEAPYRDGEYVAAETAQSGQARQRQHDGRRHRPPRTRGSPGVTSIVTNTVMGLLLTTDLNPGDRLALLLADDGDRLDLQYLSGALTLGDGDTDIEVCEVEAYPHLRLLVGRLTHPGRRERNLIAGLLLDRIFPPGSDRWWLDLRGGVVITALCDCGAPCDLPDHIHDAARAVSDSIPRGKR